MASLASSFMSVNIHKVDMRMIASTVQCNVILRIACTSPSQRSPSPKNTAAAATMASQTTEPVFPSYMAKRRSGRESSIWISLIMPFFFRILQKPRTSLLHNGATELLCPKYGLTVSPFQISFYFNKGVHQVYDRRVQDSPNCWE